jgi:hypothetical protein
MVPHAAMNFDLWVMLAVALARHARPIAEAL